jgi:2-polyprenyl-3-methyl-5-hydroxy-6-metoxy-1,4-benzoquinol methylase
MENLTACPICGNQSFKSYMECKDFTVSRETFAVVSCESCGFRFTNPRPESEKLGRYYVSEDYVSHSNSSKGIINWVYQKVRKITLRRKLCLIESFYSKGRILDIGCGTGEFLNECKLAGWDPIGIEPSPDAKKYAAETYGLNVLTEEGLTQIEKESIDIITMWHVLEHVPNLRKRVLEMKKLIKPGGTILIAVPNCGSFDSKHYGEFWAAYDVPRHLYHFQPNDIKRLFGECGMQVLEILPMKFDAYYVSMLSEKYLHGNTRLIPALVIGMKSNWKASLSGESTYSSQIYIIKSE